MAMQNPAPFIDHTLLKSTTTAAQIDLLCEEAVEFGFAAVCIPPVYVRQAADRLYGSSVQVATVVGFPLGYEATPVKSYQARHAVAAGATEIDMVIHLGAAKAGDLQLVKADIAEVVSVSEDAEVKVIIECCEFDDATKLQLARVAVDAGADYVKTSTGFAAAGATIADVKLLAAAVAGRARVKAAGGIRDLDSCLAMLAAGAHRLGTSAGVGIARQWLERSTR